jgi:N-methylhydantoinase A/oxoprolinase/acetone carboxylase beta subunit
LSPSPPIGCEPARARSKNELSDFLGQLKRAGPKSPAFSLAKLTYSARLAIYMFGQIGHIHVARKVLTVTLETILKDAVRDAIGETIADDVREIVAKESRKALREREDQLTTLVRGAVASAIAEMLNGKASHDPH